MNIFTNIIHTVGIFDPNCGKPLPYMVCFYVHVLMVSFRVGTLCTCHCVCFHVQVHVCSCILCIYGWHASMYGNVPYMAIYHIWHVSMYGNLPCMVGFTTSCPTV